MSGAQAQPSPAGGSRSIPLLGGPKLQATTMKDLVSYVRQVPVTTIRREQPRPLLLVRWAHESTKFTTGTRTLENMSRSGESLGTCPKTGRLGTDGCRFWYFPVSRGKTSFNASRNSSWNRSSAPVCRRTSSSKGPSTSMILSGSVRDLVLVRETSPTTPKFV